MTKYQRPTSTRRESRTMSGRFRGGKLAPTMATVLRESESCMLSQTCIFELDAIAGRIVTPVTAEMVAVAVPIQAIDALKNPDESYAGNTEIIRDKLLAGTPLFGLENENEISKRLGVVPRSIGGEKKVNEAVRLAHNAAVNYLRQRKFVNAVQVLADNMNVTPAIIGQTVLDRLNGVLDPEDRVNGMVQFDTGVISAPVLGSSYLAGFSASGPVTSAGQAVGATPANVVDLSGADKSDNNWKYRQIYRKTEGGDGVGGGVTMPVADHEDARSDAHVDLSGLNIGSVSLTDFYNAELMDSIVRQMRQIVDANPEYGEEMVTRWAHGLSVEMGKTPFIIAQKSQFFGQEFRKAMDGPSLDESQTDMAVELSFTVPVPATELGMVIITFCSVKPDETLASQPHPFLSDVWGATNFVSDELARDPVGVTIRELDADCDEADEGTVAMYTGLNELKRAYVNYGFNRHIDKTTVANKTAIWQLEVPMSVTPETVIYPEELEHYPFADQDAEVCTYTISSVQTVSTPMIFGPTPVEELAQIETDNIFEDQE